jgi:N-glycosylase/DNA lyase
MADPSWRKLLPVEHYDLDNTLSSGQSFRWERHRGGWESVVRDRWVRLVSDREGIVAETAEAVQDWTWLVEYLQTQLDLARVLETFPDDSPMHQAVKSCRGLRLLRQEPWECLASFILSSTKQIVQIQQIVRLLCQRFGRPIAVPEGHDPAFTFPTAERIAACPDCDLRACKMGFRAPYLLGTAQVLVRGEVDLAPLGALRLEQARTELLKLPGVGRKIADCVLLFGYGFQKAFPVDVWVMKALRQLYFPRKRRITMQQVQDFSARHFGPHAGYAQQYLFHYMRTKQAADLPQDL